MRLHLGTFLCVLFLTADRLHTDGAFKMPLTCWYPVTRVLRYWNTNTPWYTVCPNCSNVLTISRADPAPKYPLGVNRFECRTCPYQYILKGGWSEKTPMKQKEVEDVFGGKEEFANADSMGSKWRTYLTYYHTRFRRLTLDCCVSQLNVLLKTATETGRISSNCRFEARTNL